MSGGAFRDAGNAAFERVAILEQENADLEAKLTELSAELNALRREDGQRHEQPREISRLQVQLAAERADLKKALTELQSLARKLEAAEKAVYAARDERQAAERDAGVARGELHDANEQLAAAREQIRELRIALKDARTNRHVEVETKVPENLDAYMRRIQEERDELREEVRLLKEAAAKAAQSRGSLLGTLFGRR